MAIGDGVMAKTISISDDDLLDRHARTRGEMQRAAGAIRAELWREMWNKQSDDDRLKLFMALNDVFRWIAGEDNTILEEFLESREKPSSS